MFLLTPDSFKDYQLLDSGAGEKLERFGAYVLARPEPQAVWDKSLSEEEWSKSAHAVFRKDKNNPEKGRWERTKKMPEHWEIHYASGGMELSFKLSLSSFKHVGLFPEQAVNWDYIYKKTKSIVREQTGKQPATVLNLFAYTGGASLAAKSAGADVTHVDSVKQVISWARENMEVSRMNDIRWMVDDAMKFVQREIRRGKIYNGIILDPPAYGRGPEGEKWLLEEHINEMMKLCGRLLTPERNFFILNLYSIGFSALIAENLIKDSVKNPKNLEYGELFLQDDFQKKLPLGVFGRFSDAS